MTQAVQPETGLPAAPGLKYRIVVADDEDEILQELVRRLSEDYQVVGVASGRELVDVARDLGPDVVIVDISMPEINGFEAVMTLKSEGVNAKVIFFTTHGNPLYVRKAFSLGATGYVLKELGVEELLVALRTVLTGGTFVSPSIEHIFKELPSWRLE